MTRHNLINRFEGARLQPNRSDAENTRALAPEGMRPLLLCSILKWLPVRPQLTGSCQVADRRSHYLQRFNPPEGDWRDRQALVGCGHPGCLVEPKYKRPPVAVPDTYRGLALELSPQGAESLGYQAYIKEPRPRTTVVVAKLVGRGHIEITATARK